MDGHRGWSGTGISREFPKRSRRAWNLQNYTPEDGAFWLIRSAPPSDRSCNRRAFRTGLFSFLLSPSPPPLSLSFSSFSRRRDTELATWHTRLETGDSPPSRRKREKRPGVVGRQVQQSVRFPRSFYPKAIAPLLSFSFVERGGGGGRELTEVARYRAGEVTSNSRGTFSSQMKYQIYRSRRRSETGTSDIEKLASGRRGSDTSRETGQKFMAG